MYYVFFFLSSRRRHTRYIGDWSSDVCSSDLQVVRLHEGIAQDPVGQVARRRVGGRRHGNSELLGSGKTMVAQAAKLVGIIIVPNGHGGGHAKPGPGDLLRQRRRASGRGTWQTRVGGLAFCAGLALVARAPGQSLVSD